MLDNQTNGRDAIQHSVNGKDSVELNAIETIVENESALQKIYDLLPETIGRVLHPMGRFQVLFVLLLSINSAIVGMNNTITSFHTYTPSYTCNYEVRA